MWGWISFGLLVAYLAGFATAIIAGNRYMQQRNLETLRHFNPQEGNNG